MDKTIKHINQKLFNLQQEIGAISKDASNPFYKSKYFDINSLIKQLNPLLLKHKLLLLQPIEDNMVVSRIICIESNSAVNSFLTIPAVSDPQKLGSAITYLRRYTLSSLLGLQAEDDDANAASGKGAEDDNANATSGKGRSELEKKWLNINTVEFTKAIEYLKNGGDIEAIKGKYRVSKKIQDELSRV